MELLTCALRKRRSWSGAIDLMLPVAAPPFVNYLSFDRTLLRGMVKCRCARLLQMRLTKEALRGALRQEVQVWRRSGYDSRLITQLWSRLWKYPGMEKNVCAYVAGHRPRI